MDLTRTALLQRATAALRRRRWELAPVGVASAYATIVEAHAATGPSWETPWAYGVVAAAAGTGAVKLTTRNQAAAYASTGAAAATSWAAWQTAAGPSVAGLVVWGIATCGLGVPYWRWMTARRDTHRHDDATVQVAQYRAAAKTGTALPVPADAPAPALPARAALPVAPWPGLPGTTSITDPVALSPHTRINLPGRHVLIGGTTDFGKSGVVHLIAAHVITCTDARLMCIDMKPGAVELGIYRRAGVRVASGAEQARALLTEVIAEGRRRGEQMGATTMDEGTLTRTWAPTPEAPHLVVIIDELAELVDDVPSAADDLRSVTRLLRAMGITIIAATQSPSRRVFGGDTDSRGQYGVRVCLRTAEPTQTNIVLGTGAHGAGWAASDLLTQPGEFLVQSSQHRAPIPDRAYYMDDAQITAHVDAHARPPTHLDAEPDPFEPPSREKPGVLADRIVQWLDDHGPAQPAAVARALGEPGGSVRPTLAVLLRKGRLAKRDDGTYTVPAARPATGRLVALPGGRT